jgi:multidrug efflux pump subunit AcrB
LEIELKKLQKKQENLSKDMDNKIQNILQKFTEHQVQLASRKPQALLKDAVRFNQQIDNQKQRIEKVFLAYRNAYNEWQRFLLDIDEKSTQLYLDINQTADKLRDLGVEPKTVSELMKANDENARISRDINGLKKLYSKPE